MTPSEREMKIKMFDVIKNLSDENGNPYFTTEWVKTNILEDSEYIKYTKRKRIIAKLLDK